MGRRRARLIASAVVLSCALATIGSAQVFETTSNPAMTQLAPFGTGMAILVTIRNVSAGSQTITGVTKSPVSNAGCDATISIARASGAAFPALLGANGGFEQLVIRSTGFTTTGEKTCVWNIASTGNAGETFTTTMRVDGASTVALDPQPQLLKIGHATQLFEVQNLLVTNYLPTMATVTASLGSGGPLTFVGGSCDGQASCALTLPGKTSFDMKVRCQLPSSSGGTVAGIITYGSGSGTPVASHGYECTSMGSGTGSGFGIVEDTIVLEGGLGVAQTEAASISGSGNALTSATITGTDATRFRFASTFCGSPSQTCTPSSPIPTPTQLLITCTPDGTPRAATLTVQGSAATDVDTAMLRCRTSAAGPQIALMPSPLLAGSVPVGQVGTTQLMISNPGDASLVVSFQPSDPDWSVNKCVTGTPCTVAPGGTEIIAVSFAPSVHGPDNATLGVTANVAIAVAPLDLIGTGTGATLRVTDPGTPFLVDFGTIARGQLVARTVSLATQGTHGLAVDVGSGDPATAPFSTSTSSVNLPTNGTGSFEVRCQAATAGGPHDDRISISSAAYAANTPHIDARCRIANTIIQVMPSTLDFGEVRVGAPTRELAITITNPGAPVELRHVRLSASSPGLSLDAPAAGTLATNATVMAKLSLATTMDLVLDDVALEIGIDAEELVLPITGRVVTAAAHVTPENLDLGTACLGTPVTGNVMMINAGTATLRLQPPTLDQAFTPLFLDPTTYPPDGTGAPLAPGAAAMAGVTPSTSATGMIKGTLTWDVDVANAPFSVPVSLEYIDSGTALSPRQLAFGTIDVATQSPQQTITLQNCNEAPSLIAVRGVVAMTGDGDAWNVSPRVLETMLAARDTLKINVRFEPKRPGRHVARIELEVDGEARFVDLSGDAIGVIRETQSFYNCSCDAPGAPARGWPILVALVLVLVPRRRR